MIKIIRPPTNHILQFRDRMDKIGVHFNRMCESDPDEVSVVDFNRIHT